MLSCEKKTNNNECQYCLVTVPTRVRSSVFRVLEVLSESTSVFLESFPCVNVSMEKDKKT